jgi:transposase
LYQNHRMGMSKAQEKDYAKILFTTENLTQKEIAERVKVSEKTITKWIKEGGWAQIKKSLLVTKQHQISMLYDQLDWLNNLVSNRDVKVFDSKEADVVSKITASIQRLEIETSVGQVIEVARGVIDFVREIDLDKAKEITKYFDSYIQSKMK